MAGAGAKRNGAGRPQRGRILTAKGEARQMGIGFAPERA